MWVNAQDFSFLFLSSCYESPLTSSLTVHVHLSPVHLLVVVGICCYNTCPSQLHSAVCDIGHTLQQHFSSILHSLCKASVMLRHLLLLPYSGLRSGGVTMLTNFVQIYTNCAQMEQFHFFSFCSPIYFFCYLLICVHVKGNNHITS